MLAYLIPFSARHFVCTLAWPFQQWNQLEFRLIEIKFKVAFDRKTFCYFYPVQNLCHATPTGRALSHKCVSYKNKRNWGNWDFGQHMGMRQCVFMLWRLFNAYQTQQQQQCPQMTGLSEQCGRGRGQARRRRGPLVRRNVTGPTSIAMNMIIFLTPVFIVSGQTQRQLRLSQYLCVCVCVCKCIFYFSLLCEYLMRGMARHLARHIAQVAAKSSANGSNLCETNSFKYPFAGLRTLYVCVCISVSV